MKETFRLLIDAKTKGANNIKRLGNSMQGLQGKVKNAGLAVQGLSKAFAVLGVAMGAGVFAASIKSAIDQADAMGKLSTRTGVAADKLQAFVNAGKLADVSQSQLTSGLRVFARTQAEAAEGVATYADAYAKLGVSVSRQDGSLKASDQLLGEIADKFADLPNGPEKAAVAMDIFGRSGAQMITLLNGGSESLERFNYELSENFAQNAEYFNDQITELGIKFEAFRMQLMDALLPALNAIMEVFSDLFSTDQDFNALFTVITAGVRGVAAVVLSLVAAFRFFARTLTDLVKIADAVRRLDFGAAKDIAAQGLSDTRAQAVKDFAGLGKVLTGTSEAGESYFNRSSGEFTRRADASAQALGSRASAERARLEQGILNAREKQLEAAAAALTADREQIRNLQQRLSAANLEQQILLETDAIKRIQLESDQRRNALYTEHARQMQGGVSIEHSLAAAKLLQVQLTNENIETQQQLAEAIANTKEESKSFDQSFRDGLEQMGNLAENLGNRLSSAVGEFSDAFTDFLITGKQSFQEFAASLLSDLSRVFMRFAMINALKAVIGNADGNVFQGGSIVPYAKGGIVRRPTLFPMANGLGLMGEAGPEAVMPLRRHANGRLGVEASGGAGNVVVNVDARGTQVEGDNARSRQLGDAIGVAVREELIAQKRPGGLLS